MVGAARRTVKVRAERWSEGQTRRSRLRNLPVMDARLQTVRRLMPRRWAHGTTADGVMDVVRAMRGIAADLAGGLTPAAAGHACARLRSLLGAVGVGLADHVEVLGWSGRRPPADLLTRALGEAARDGRRVRATAGDATLTLTPLLVGDNLRGMLAVLEGDGRARARLQDELAVTIAGALDLADVRQARTWVAEAELRTLRAQISPHFICNALTAIASLVRSDPERARRLLLEFADYTRYGFGRHGAYTTLAEELRAIEIYLTLEQARFGDRLQVRLEVSPEVLPMPLPFLVLQPLVENAVRHGVGARPAGGTVRVTAYADGDECVVCVEDDGQGMDPHEVAEVLAGRRDRAGVGLRNVDERLRAVYGGVYGLVVETAPGAGTKTVVRLPRWRAGVSAG